MRIARKSAPPAPAGGPDPAWRDPVAYAFGIVEEMWEGRRTDVLAGGDGPVLRRADAVLDDPAAIAAAMREELAAFPRVEILGEDVIWAETAAEDGDGQAGYLASHRSLRQGQHLGGGAFGSSTGRAGRHRAILDLWCADGEVRDAWEVRDTGALLAALGLDADVWLRRRLEADDAAGRLPPPLMPDTDVEGPYVGRGPRAGAGAMVADRLAEILRRLGSGDATASAEYDRACALACPGGREAVGRAAAEAFWMGLKAAFPSAVFRIDHRVGMAAGDDLPPRAAIRWSLYGRHDGWGHFGAPTGAYVFVMGMTHAEFGPRGLRREWTLYDETAIRAQILLARG